MIIPRFETRKSQRFEDANYRKTRKSHGKNTLVSSRFSLKNNTLKKTLQKQVVAEELVVCNGGLPLGVGHWSQWLQRPGKANFTAEDGEMEVKRN